MGQGDSCLPTEFARSRTAVVLVVPVARLDCRLSLNAVRRHTESDDDDVLQAAYLQAEAL